MSCKDWETTKPINLTVCPQKRGSVPGTRCADVLGRNFGVYEIDFEKWTEEVQHYGMVVSTVKGQLTSMTCFKMDAA